MKYNHKPLLSFIFPVIGISLLCFWAYTAKEPFNFIGYLVFTGCLLLIGMGLYFKLKTVKSVREGLAPEDELSKRIKEKAAAKAFGLSIYMWLFVILFVMKIEPADKIIIGLGLMGMILIFFCSWLHYSKAGITDENKD